MLGFNLKSKYALTTTSYASFTSSCIAFSSANTLFAFSNTGANAFHVTSVYMFVSKSLILFTNACNSALSPLINSNIWIALAKRANALSTCAWLALLLAKTSWAWAKAALNSFATTGTTFSNCSSLTLFATSTAISNAVLSTVLGINTLIASFSAATASSISVCVLAASNNILALAKIVMKLSFSTPSW